MTSEPSTPYEFSPYPLWESIRTRGDVVWDDAEFRGWVVTAYHLCRQVLLDEQTFAAPPLRAPRGGTDAARQIFGGSRALMALRGEPHRILHRRTLQAIQRQLDGLDERLTPLLQEQIRLLQDRETIEFCGAFADELPAIGLCAVLGADTTDPEVRRCGEWNRAIDHWTSTAPDDELAFAQARNAGQGFDRVLRRVAQARRSEPWTDLTSEIWQLGRDVFPDWDIDDVIASCRVLFFAGDSTAQLVSNMAFLLYGNPGLLQQVNREADAVDLLVEETLRATSVVQFRKRVATVDTAIGATAVSAGDPVYVALGAANRDPRRFESPRSVSLHRQRRANLAFGAGVRFCPGAPLARRVAALAMRLFLEAFPNAALDPAGPTPRCNLGGRSTAAIRPLPLRLNAGAQLP